MTVRVAGSAATAHSDLILVCDWFNTKDKLVGTALDDGLMPVAKWLKIAGSMLLASAVVGLAMCYYLVRTTP